MAPDIERAISLIRGNEVWDAILPELFENAD
jgi:hypothetical protein